MSLGWPKSITKDVDSGVTGGNNNIDGIFVERLDVCGSCRCSGVCHFETVAESFDFRAILKRERATCGIIFYCSSKPNFCYSELGRKLEAESLPYWRESKQKIRDFCKILHLIINFSVMTVWQLFPRRLPAFTDLFCAKIYHPNRSLVASSSMYKSSVMSIGQGSDSQVKVAEKPYWEPDEFEYEQLERYDHGGFCPVLIWQRFDNDRYRVAYKLGYGHFSTVWLAQDLQKERYVALKILSADQFDRSSEADMLRAVANSDESSLAGQKYIIPLLDSFEHESVNGKHHVLVFPLSRPLVGLRSLNMNFPLMAKSLVMGLDYLHAAGIIHGGKVRSP